MPEKITKNNNCLLRVKGEQLEAVVLSFCFSRKNIKNGVVRGHFLKSFLCCTVPKVRAPSVSRSTPGHSATLLSSPCCLHGAEDRLKA